MVDQHGRVYHRIPGPIPLLDLSIQNRDFCDIGSCVIMETMSHTVLDSCAVEPCFLQSPVATGLISNRAFVIRKGRYIFEPSICLLREA